jgi:hypothetical protein
MAAKNPWRKDDGERSEKRQAQQKPPARILLVRVYPSHDQTRTLFREFLLPALLGCAHRGGQTRPSVELQRRTYEGAAKEASSPGAICIKLT